MKTTITEMLWLDEQHTLSLTELSELSGLTATDINELVDYGVITPAVADKRGLLFHARCVLTAKTAFRLRHDFELDTRGLALAMTLIERMQALEGELRELGAKLPGGWPDHT